MKKTKEATPIAKKSDDTGSKEILDDQGDNARTPVQSESEISRAETTPNLSGKQRTSAGDIQNGVRVVASAKVPRVMSFNNMSSWGKSSSSKRQDSAASSVSAVESEVDTGEGDTINVVVRVRPLSKQEQEKKDGTSIQFPGEGAMWMDNNGSTRPFTFNVVFEPEASQQDVFDHSGMMKLIDMAINGYSCTTFAFGQTGSGKTHTITGPPQLYQDEPDKEHELYGLIPRSFRYLMKQIGDRHLIQSASTFIRASYLEIYNEQVIDLLNPNQHGNLQVRWSKNKGFYVENLFVIECETLDDLFAVLEEGLKNRQTGSHNLNEFSSRSHSMLSLMIDSEMQDPDDENVYITKHGKLTFVDLAGSEKVKDSQSSGEQLIETNNINRSLLVLGNCISSLGDPKKRNGHIPYRDSKLTKLLADSLGGNGVTLMIACVSPASSNAPETMNTLRYANRAKKIKNKPVVKMDPREKLIISLKRELKLLRTENHYLREQLHFPSTTQGKHIGEEGELLQVSKLIADETSKDPFLALEKKEDGKDRNSNLVNRQDTLTSIKSAADSGLYEMLQEYMIENETLRSENTDLTKFKEEFKREHQTLSRENDKLIKKLDDLERAMSAGSFHPFNNAFNGYRRRSDNDYYYPSPDLSLSLSSTPMLHSSYNSFLSEQNYASSPNGQRSARQSNDLPPVNPMRSGAYQHNAQQVQRPRLYQGQSNSPPGMPAQSMRPANRYPPPRLSPSQGYAGVGPMSTSPRAYQGGVNGGPVQVGSNPVMYPGPPGATWPPGNGSGPGNATQRDYAPRQSYRGPQNQQQNYNSSRAPPMGAPNHEYYGADNNIVNGQGDVPSKGPGGYKSRVQKPQEQINVNNPLRDSQTVLPNQSNIPPNGRNETQTIPKKTTPRQAKGEAAQKPSSYAKLLSKKSPGAVESKVQPTPRDNTKDNTPYEEIQDMNEKLRQELADLEGEIKQHQRLIDPKPAGNGKR